MGERRKVRAGLSGIGGHADGAHAASTGAGRDCFARGMERAVPQQQGEHVLVKPQGTGTSGCGRGGGCRELFGEPFAQERPEVFF